jgi:hypothetical protein
MSSNLQIFSIALAANALIAGAAPAGAQTGEVIRWNRVATETRGLSFRLGWSLSISNPSQEIGDSH